MYTAQLPCTQTTPVYLSDAQDAQQVDSTSHLLNLVSRILKGDNISTATTGTFEDVCKAGIKKKLRENQGKIIAGGAVIIISSALLGYQAKKHNLLGK